MATGASNEVERRQRELGKLWWLIDAPLFIDRDLVARIHDAIVRPKTVRQKAEEMKFDKLLTNLKAEGNLEAKADFKLPVLDWIGPKLEATGKVGGDFEREAEQQTRSTQIVSFIHNSERKLNELVGMYLDQFPERILFKDVPGGQYVNYQGFLTESDVEKLLNSPPRPLVFLNIKNGAILCPTMVELESTAKPECGAFRAIYSDLIAELFKDNPDDAPEWPLDENMEDRRDYWKRISDRFSSRKAMIAIENGCADGRIGWIDFRVALNEKGRTAHLHIVPRGEYHTGVFAYNFTHRSFLYGSRVVGYLKKGNDINVLAIYDH